MNYIKKSEQEAELLCSVTKGQWGTIGPHFLNANQKIAQFAHTQFALVTFSASAALETVLRAKNIGWGDQVIVGDWSDPVESMTAAAVGATPVFAKASDKQLTADAVAQVITPDTKAVIAGLSSQVAEISALCQEKNLYFILNLGDSWGVQVNGKPAVSYANAAVVDMSQGCVMDLGLCGAALTDSDDDFNLFYAYHNCGRPLGEGSTLSFDAIIGGDLRVAEWQAVMIEDRLEQLKAMGEAVSQKTACEYMADAPFWQTEYYQKLTK